MSSEIDDIRTTQMEHSTNPNPDEKISNVSTLMKLFGESIDNTMIKENFTQNTNGFKKFGLSIFLSSIVTLIIYFVIFNFNQFYTFEDPRVKLSFIIGTVFTTILLSYQIIIFMK